jgi:hypothetical protein
MKRTNIFYWITTGLFAFVMFSSAIPNALVTDAAVQGFGQMHMPAYLLAFLGIAKILGVTAILIQGNFPRIREWAYAGLIFDLIGAIWSIAASGVSIAMWSPMLLFVALGFASYALYHKRIAFRAAKNEIRAADHETIKNNPVLG